MIETLKKRLFQTTLHPWSATQERDHAPSKNKVKLIAYCGGSAEFRAGFFRASAPPEKLIVECMLPDGPNRHKANYYCPLLGNPESPFPAV
jgi:hypothetical protein